MKLIDLQYDEYEYYSTYTFHTNYSYFLQFALWNIDKIAGDSMANGFIVQKIDMKISGNHDCYYEAWPVQNGKINRENSICDDCFCGEYNSIYGNSKSFFVECFDSLNNSINTEGESIINSCVYWIDKSNYLYNSILKWKKGKVPQAMDLISEYSINLSCSFIQKINLFQKCERHFIHTWKFMNEKVILSTLVEFIVEFCLRRDFYMDNINYCLKHFDLKSFKYLENDVKQACCDKLNILYFE